MRLADRFVAPLWAFGRFIAGGQLSRLASAGALLVVLASGYALVHGALNVPKVGVNSMSRLASVQSLVEFDDWSIERSMYRRTPDVVFVEGHFYSSKPPVYPAMAAAVYWAVYVPTTQAIRTLSSTRQDDVRQTLRTELPLLIRFSMHVLPFMVGLLLAGRFLRRQVVHDAVWFWGFVAFGAGTFMFGYSTVVNNHGPAALLVLAAFAGAWSVGNRNESRWLLFGVGFCAALATTFDLGVGLFGLCLAVYLVLTLPRRRLVFWFVAGAVAPLVVHLILTQRLTGSIRPFYSNPEFYDYPGSYWRNPGTFDLLHEPLWVYAFNSLVGHHGLLTMTPLFVLALPGMVELLKRDGRAWGLLVGVTVVGTILIYLLFGPRNYGGNAQGMRWFIVLTPMLWYAACRFADRRWGWVMRVVLPLLVLIGVYHASHAIKYPWSASPWHLLLSRFGMDSLPPNNTFFQ